MIWRFLVFPGSYHRLSVLYQILLIIITKDVVDSTELGTKEENLSLEVKSFLKCRTEKLENLFGKFYYKY